jgi:hypothetical protein
LDNREYFNNYAQDQTIFGARTFGQTGIAINKSQEFAVGLNILYEFGSSLDHKNIDPVLYFHFENKLLNLYLGSCERKGLINLPLLLQSDTFQYYKPNIEGMFLEVRKPWGFQNVWLDWTSRQTNENREIFLIGGTGILKVGAFFYRHDFIITHYAKTAVNAPHEHIRDNGGFSAGIGVDFSKQTFFDSLSLSTGFAMSYDRRRNIYLYPFEYYEGSITELNAEYRAFGLKFVTYFGDGQVQMAGDPLYRAKFYNRIDLFIKFFKKGPVKGEVKFSLHFIEDIVDISQVFTIYLNIGGTRSLNTSANISDR